MSSSKKYYIDSFPYEIELIARVCHENARRILEQYTNEISIEEFTVLDTIVARPNLSQADLARLILKGKAHTGRFLMSLEKKGLIARKIYERDGKLIKISVITEKGKAFYDDIVSTFRPHIAQFEQLISEEEVKLIVKSLQKLRAAMEELGKIVFE